MCPRCSNSDIKTSDNFCKICGLKLKKTPVRGLGSRGLKKLRKNFGTVIVPR